MNARDKRAREIQKAIRQVLLHDWDPIGVSDVAQAQDEYDSYVGGIYRLLASGAAPLGLAEHLAGIENGLMGIKGSPDLLMPIAQKLSQIDVRLDLEEQLP